MAEPARQPIRLRPDDAQLLEQVLLGQSPRSAIVDNPQIQQFIGQQGTPQMRQLARPMPVAAPAPPPAPIQRTFLESLTDMLGLTNPAANPYQLFDRPEFDQSLRGGQMSQSMQRNLPQ